MTLLPRRRWIAPAVAAALAATSLMALTASPASAATSTFSNTTRTYLGDPSRQTFVSTAALTIPDSGTASVYPSQITVPQGASISDLNVRLNGLTHSDTYDLDVLLVGPQGQQVTLMANAGGIASNATLTFDDEAGSTLPTTTFNALPSGTYKPTSNITRPWPAPAPAATGNTSLAVFDGTSAGGVWSLYVNDAAGGDAGSISSWNLLIDLDTRPYPSTIPVTGLPPISDVNVTLTGFDSEYPDDVEILLVGPGGQQSILMYDVGGSNDVSGATYVIDDEAAAAFPDDDPLPSGTYRPTNSSPGHDPWPDPAPVASGNVPLSVFDGISPNGDWHLFAYDNGGNDLSSIGGWSLQFTWADTQAPTGTVSVNGGAATATSTNVTLGLSAADPAPGTGVTQMRFSNDGVTYSAFQPYAASAAWTLTSGDGLKTVFAQFRDGEGNISAAFSDGITLALPDTTGPTATKLTPKKNAKDVKVSTKVKVKASEALKGKTVNAKTVFLKAKGSAKKVKATVTYNAKGKTIVLKPTSSLKGGTKYTLTVSTKVKDLAGNAFDAKPAKSGAQALKFSFTTA